MVAGIGQNPYIKPVERTAISGTQISIDLMDEKKEGWGNRILLGLHLAFYELSKTLKTRSSVGIIGSPTQQAKAEAGLFVIREMAKIAGELNAKLVLLNIGRLDAMDPAGPSLWLPLPAAFLAGLPEEVIFLGTADAVKDLYSRNPGEKLTLPEDVHPNAKAHELFAEILRQKIVTFRSPK